MKLINVISLLIGLTLPVYGQGIPIITTIAGGGPNNVAALNAGLDQPTGGAVDSAGNFYFAGDSQVFRLSLTGHLTVVAGVSVKGSGGDGGPATRAGLYFPFAVALDGLGNLYIADNRNNRVRKLVLSTGIISTIAGNGSGCGNSFTTFPAPATSVCVW